jgi:HAD superfamily hydrolase (TIGR01509 family)
MTSATPRLGARALLLDMDGLMVDSEPLWFEVERAFVRTRGGAEFTVALGQRCVGKGLRETLRVMHEACGIVVDEGRDPAVIIDLFIASVGGLALKPGCEELLEAAAGRVPLALASSSSRRLIDAVVARFGIGPRFGAIVSGEDVAHTKPAPDIFLKAAEALGIDPPDCVVLEDSFAGVTAGRAAGMQVIAVPEGDPSGRGFEWVAARVVRDLHEARAHIEFV